MTITSVEESKANKMVRIFIDNHYAFAIPQEDYIRNHLYEEGEITAGRLEHIRKDVLVRAAREKGVYYLTIRDRSEGQLLKKLTEVGFDEDIARIAANELKGLGYLNDSRYAMRYLAGRIKTKALSQKALRYELAQKYIPADIIETVFSEFEVDDEEVAFRAARKKFGKYDLDDEKVQGKVLNFLLHRGFSFDIGYKVLKLMKEERK